MFQSTHPHGVRRFKSPATTSVKMFQSTHPHGVRQLTPHHYPTDDLFQSTHPHGVRPCRVLIHRGHYHGFNPRTHTGCDFFLSLRYQFLLCFNPRTHTGCDSGLQFLDKFPWLVSIHAPTRGATPDMIIKKSRL